MTRDAVPAPDDSWTVAIYHDASSLTPVGTGVVIDRRRILTCAHLLWDQQAKSLRRPVWVTFPKAGLPFLQPLPVTGVTAATGPSQFRGAAAGSPSGGLDLAVLELDTPVPAAVSPAPISCLAAAAMSELDWWAFGFPRGAGTAGGPAFGRFGSPLALGLVQLDTTSKSRLEEGFSGGAVWSPAHQAVVGLVLAASGADQGSGHALTLHQVHLAMPELRLNALAEPGSVASNPAAWGWRLRDDPERGRHWEPRGRGALSGEEEGYRFRGRDVALNQIVRWLDRPHLDRTLLVVTGSPGVGKSAVLARIVTTADPELSPHLPAGDKGFRARTGSVACAVHAKGKTAHEAAIEIARAAALPLPGEPEGLLPPLLEQLTAHRQAGKGRRFNLVVDALDEAASPAEARRLLDKVLLPLARSGPDVDAQVLIGTRRRDRAGDLLASIEKHTEMVDLDHADYLDAADLTAYAEATLHQAATGRPGSPYADPALAVSVAQQIADRADGNFLIAGLMARAHGERDRAPASPEQLADTPTVDAALDAYLAGLGDAGTTPVRLALTVLAFAEPPGLPLPLWQAGVAALGGTADEDQLATLARRSAAAFLMETNTGPTVRVYRLFHQALAEALRRHRAAYVDERNDQRRLFEAWHRIGKGTGWAQAYQYLHRNLPAHAVPADRIDTLLTDDGYLLHADLRRLAPAGERARTDQGRARVRLLQLTPQSFDADPSQRAAMFSVTEQLDQPGSDFRATRAARYRARWADTAPRAERTALTGHADRVLDVEAVPVAGRHVLASAGEDGTVRLWNPATGQPEQVLTGHTAAVRVVCPVPAGLAGPLPPTPVLAGTPQLLASAGDDRTIRLWDPATGNCERILRGHTDWVRDACAILVAGAHLLATASDDHTVRLWEPTTGHCVRVLDGHPGWVSAVAPVAGGQLLASAGLDAVIRLWDPATGELVRTVATPADWVTALRPVRAGGRELLAVAGYDSAVRLVDPATGEPVRNLPAGSRPVTGLATVISAGTGLLAVTAEGSPVRLWDPATGHKVREFSGHIGGANGACAIPTVDRGVLATAGDDGTVRLWDPATGLAGRVLDRIGPVVTLTGVMVEGVTRVAGAGPDGSVRIWDLTRGTQLRRLSGHSAPVTAVSPITVDGEGLLASGGEDQTVRLWRPGTGHATRVLTEEHPAVTAVCPVPPVGTAADEHAPGEHPPGGDHATGTDLLAVASDAVRLWHPGTRRVVQVLGHLRWVTAVCVVPAPGGHLLASSDDDGTVRLWNPAGGALIRELRSHHGATTALCAVPTRDRYLLASASADRTILLWEPETGERVKVLSGHRDRVTGVCAVPVGGRHLLASTSTDRTARLWDPTTGQVELTIPVHHAALSCWAGAGTLVLGLDAGLLALDLHLDPPPAGRRPGG